MMICDECGGVTQQETVVEVRRALMRLRSQTRQAWYCWTCKTSRPAAAALPRLPHAGISRDAATAPA